MERHHLVAQENTESTEMLAFGADRVVEEVGVGETDAVLQLGLVGPAEGGGLRDVEELAGGAVGTGGVPLDAAFVADDFGDELGEGLDGELLTGAGIHGFVTAIVVHEEDTEVGEVVDIEELAEG